MRRRLLLGATLAVAAACPDGSYFVCNDDGDCASQAAEGVCQPTGACSFPDGECPSGQRYGSAGHPSLANECVDADAGTTSTSGDPSSDAPAGSSSEGPPGDATGEPCPADWWDCAWAHRQRLSLRSAVGETLTDVPVLVLLADGRVDHGRMQADGEDVRLVSSSGIVLPHEIERWDPAGVSALWVGVDALGPAADHVWLYYGNPVAERAEDPTGVWPEPYVGVWHLEGDPTDSTAQGNHATPSGNTALVPGHVADGRSIVGNGGRLDVGANESLADLFAGGGTLSAWVRLRSFGGYGYGRIANKADASADAGWLFAASEGSLRFHHWIETSATAPWHTDEGTIELHRWHHVAVTFDALAPALPRMFIDGEELPLVDPDEVPVVDAIPTDVEIPLTLGNRTTNDRRFDGILDEIRMERTVRSPEWIRVQHDSMRDALLEYGPIESWGGA